MRVLVFGGTRGVGRFFSTRAAETGHEITLFARDPAAISAWATPAMRVVRGDARNRNDVVAAIPAHDAVVVSLGPSGFERFQRFIGPATAWIVEAMEAANIRRLLFVSAVGVGDSRREAPGFVRWFLAPILIRTTFADRSDAEEIVRRANLNWTLVRPLYLTDAPPSGRWNASTKSTDIRGGISRADVAEFMLTELTEKKYLRQAVAIEAAQSD